jgi:spore coat protein CotH
LGLLFPIGCGSSSNNSTSEPIETATGVCGDDTDTIKRPATWTTNSHCPNATADYDEVFDATTVRRLDITIDPATFKASEDDLVAIFAAQDLNPGPLDALGVPMWMDATITYNAKTWTHVGIRWKGHASLKGAWSARIRKLSMKAKFDAFEDANPETTDQRFFGFKGFSLGNAYKDPSFIRDKTAADIFRAAGVPAPRSSFVQIYIDTGSGPFYMGMYTIIEEPDDHMIDAQLGNDSGNLYKPWGEPAKWLPIAETSVADSSVTQADIQTYFERGNNDDVTDWSDAIAAVNAVNADRTDAAAWRTQLEAVFDVQSFLKTLAVNQTMVNWDSYGCMPHNYLLYANPLNENRFVWMPWDLNEALQSTEHDGCVPSSVMLDEIVSGTDATITQKWPLIQYILGDSTYRETYKTYLRAVLDGAFAAETVKAQMRADHNLIAPYLDGTLAKENGATTEGPFSSSGTYQNASLEAFQSSLVGGTNALETHVDARHTAVEAALAAP